MGKLLHGAKFELEVDDESLFHLDMALTMLGTEGLSIRVHTLMGGSVISFPSDGIVFIYENAPHLKIDEALLDVILAKAREAGLLSLPFLTVPFERDSGEVLD
ncbi:hypothetical protein ASC66_01065 [Leifsonia sp. Root4]|uniref:hypothetical protein n=1 Tax=Leifsonia sp. Root4 TaxID=1736525 RepID=UPI0006FFF428|nr:hypothetical protein [Leifsonia sp. Root4]KQW07619.1 hypothetical protein ASC66_01065 [Leifsonia sp. Root4]